MCGFAVELWVKLARGMQLGAVLLRVRRPSRLTRGYAVASETRTPKIARNVKKTVSDENTIADAPISKLVALAKQCASLKHPDPTITASLTAQIRANSTSFTPTTMASITTSLSNFQLKAQDKVELMEHLSKAILTMPPFSPSAQTQVMIACSKVYFRDVRVFLKFAAESQDQKFDPFQIANILTSMAKFEYYNEEWNKILFAQALEQADKFEPLGISFLLSALAKLDVYNEELVATFCGVAKSKMDAFSEQNIPMLLTALAKFDWVDDKQLLDGFCVKLREAESLFAQNITLSLFAFSVLNHYDKPTIASLRRKLLKPGVMRDVPAAGLDQMYQASVWLSSEYGMQFFPAEQEEWLISTLARKKTYRNVKHFSALHKQVSVALEAMGLRPHNEFELAPVIHVDLVLPEQRKMVEVDGHTHFFVGSKRRHGLFRFRERLAERLGLKTYRVPHYEWSELKTLDEQTNYLKHKLELS